ncbi:hypothetical protein OE88DRAFT_1420123 [Heliocybe sulcata]|uniref:Uncharacterized protein n=1 Tax=Heliocybe sulcata TaxID=5364 RepID=A0A5C3N680_9AGAM|nr:hypothetical protein OE88DRAFT_1420123 [Heliocybe sulcata]
MGSRQLHGFATSCPMYCRSFPSTSSPFVNHGRQPLIKACCCSQPSKLHGSPEKSKRSSSSRRPSPPNSRLASSASSGSAQRSSTCSPALGTSAGRRHTGSPCGPRELSCTSDTARPSATFRFNGAAKYDPSGIWRGFSSGKKMFRLRRMCGWWRSPSFMVDIALLARWFDALWDALSVIVQKPLVTLGIVSALTAILTAPLWQPSAERLFSKCIVLAKVAARRVSRLPTTVCVAAVAVVSQVRRRLPVRQIKNRISVVKIVATACTMQPCAALRSSPIGGRPRG